MVLHPGIEAIVTAARTTPSTHPSTQRIEERRSIYRDVALSLSSSHTEMHEIRDIDLAMSDRTLRTRLYVPLGDESRGLMVYFHGGSFVVGDLDTHDGLCRRLSADTKMRLLAVQYRLAPEFPFPAAIEDAVESLYEIVKNISTFASPNVQLIVIGDSAGGTLAALAAGATRHAGLPIAAQVLLYPTMGPELVTHSVHDFGTGYLFDVEHLRYDYEQYLGSWRDHSDPRVSPLMSLDLTGSPPAVIVVAEFDPLRDEAVAYAGLLEHFGNHVELLEAEGMVHDFLRLGDVVPDALAIVDDLAEHLHLFILGAHQ